MFCELCGKEFIKHINTNVQKYCSGKCRSKARHQTPEYKAWAKTYSQRTEVRERAKVYNESNEALVKQKAYRARYDIKARKKAYKQTPEYKAWAKAYSKTPEYRERQRQLYIAKRLTYMQTPEYQAKAEERAFKQSPEYKTILRIKRKAYRLSPEQDAKRKARNKIEFQTKDYKSKQRIMKNQSIANLDNRYLKYHLKRLGIAVTPDTLELKRQVMLLKRGLNNLLNKENKHEPGCFYAPREQ